MILSELILLLEDMKKERGDLEIHAFHHEGGNSLRAYPSEITRFSDGDIGSFVFGTKKDGVKYVVIGGPYD